MSKRRPTSVGSIHPIEVPTETEERVLRKVADSMGPHWTYGGVSIYHLSKGGVIVPALWVGTKAGVGVYEDLDAATAHLDALWEEMG